MSPVGAPLAAFPTSAREAQIDTEREELMQILAWIDVDQRNNEHPHVACWVSTQTPDRPPACHAFRTPDGARAWILFEAGQLGIAASDIRWISVPQSFAK